MAHRLLHTYTKGFSGMLAKLIRFNASIYNTRFFLFYERSTRCNFYDRILRYRNGSYICTETTKKQLTNRVSTFATSDL